MGTKTYPVEVDEEDWEDIKSTVSQNESLNDAVVERLKTATFSPEFTRETDSRGRFSLPKSEYGEAEVTVLVVDAEPIEEEDDDDGS